MNEKKLNDIESHADFLNWFRNAMVKINPDITDIINEFLGGETSVTQLTKLLPKRFTKAGIIINNTKINLCHDNVTGYIEYSLPAKWKQANNHTWERNL